MFDRKLLLISLLTVMAWVGVTAQNVANVFGLVQNESGEPESGVNILVSVFFADSTVIQFSEYTDAVGGYSVDIPTPGQNILGFVEVMMVDCWGTTQSQFFTILVGNEVFEAATFIYCAEILQDSCALFILQEWNPDNNVQLTAWTPPGSPVSYLWSTGETSQSIVPDASGSYCVTATFVFGCVVQDCIDVWIDSTNCYAYIVSTNNGDGTFNVEAIAAMGQAPFAYEWSTGETTSALLNISEGTYCVTVTDSIGCTYATCIIVEDFSFCEVYIYEEPNGGLYAQAFGNLPVSYLWTTGEVSDVIYPIDPGLYCVSIVDASGCETSACYEYGWGIDSCSVFVSAFVSDSNTFTLQAYAYTEAESWTFLWSTGETSDIIYPADPTQSYCVTMTDADDCISTACYESNNWCYAWADVHYIDTSEALLAVFTDPIFNIPGNTPPSYLWADGSTTPSITVVESGEYCVTVTIGADCVIETCAIVDFESLVNDCFAWVYQYPDSTGQWHAEAYAWGWGDFSYSWSNGDSSNVTLIEDPNVQTCVTVTSSLGCQTVACTDTFFLPCEAQILVNYISNHEAVLTATLWNDPSQNATFLWSTGETGPVITVTEDSVYCVTVMAGGCVKTTCVDVFFWNIDSCGVWISEDASTGAGVLYTANAWGTAPFEYLWSNGSTDSTNFVDFGIHDLCVTITDAEGCVSSGCNYTVDSCYTHVYYSLFPTPSVHVYSSEPLANVYWSTGDTLSWIEVTEPGTYCAMITTIFGCVTTSCITIDTIIPHEGFNVIGGYVFGDTLSSLSGTVYAYFMDSNTGKPYALVDSAVIGQDHYYQFSGLADGLYLLKAVPTPGASGAADYLPTYHYSSATWQDANPHTLPNWLPVTTDIYLRKTIGLQGGGVIAGFVIDPINLIANEDIEIRGDKALAQVEVILKDAQGVPMQYRWSLEDGGFRFEDLPWGTYRISFDIPGLPSPDVWVTLSPESPERLNVTLIVDQGSVAVEEPVNEEIRLYPNPATHEVNIPLPGYHANADVQMMDMQGRVVYTGSATNTNGVIVISVSSFTPGLYLINLRSEHGTYYGRFVKQD